ncbi:MAG: hypothetical protein V1726_06230 [Methanobacteriota archaeon]
MDELDYLEEEHIKTHKEILILLKELDEFEDHLEHPESPEQIPIEDETHHIEDGQEFIDVSPPEEKHEDSVPVPKPDKPKKKDFQLIKKQKRTKVPKALIETNKKFPFTRLQKKRVPKSIITHRKLFSRRHEGLHALSSTFTLHIDTNGNLIGFTNVKTSTKPGKEPGKLSRILHRKKPQTEGETTTTPPPKGFIGKIKNILPFGKKNKEGSPTETSEETGGKNKLKKLFSLKRKSKETTE